jgi:polysaccharide pyruvyl transferase CsaB
MGHVKRILMSGYYGFDNSGDDAILKAIVNDLRETDESLNITVLSNNPAKTEKMYPVKAVNRFKFSDVFRAVKETSLLISGGGSLLQDVTSTRSLLYYLGVMSLAKIFNKSVMVYANGIGPVNGRFNRFLTKLVLNKVDLITLRDQMSKDYLEEMGVNNKEIYVTSDPVFTLEPSSREVVQKIFIDEGIPQGERLLGISIREWKKANNLESKIAETIDYLIEKYNVKVVLIPMHYPEDLKISKEVLNLVQRDGCYILSKKYTVEEIMGVIKELDLIVAMRLHSLIYAATQSIPMVGLVYDPKVEGLLNSIGMTYMIDVENFSTKDLIADIDNVWSNKDDIKKVLTKQKEDLKKLALQNVKYAYDMLR